MESDRVELPYVVEPKLPSGMVLPFRACKLEFELARWMEMGAGGVVFVGELVKGRFSRDAAALSL